MLVTIQEHLEAQRLWAKHADNIGRLLGLKSTTHDTCLSLGKVEGKRVRLKRQVDDFEVATGTPIIATIILDAICAYLTSSLK